MVVRPAKSQIRLGIRPVWSESSLSARGKLGSLATHWAHSEDTDQTGRMIKLIRVFAGRTLTLFVLSRGGSNSSQYMYLKAILGRDSQYSGTDASFSGGMPHINYNVQDKDMCFAS